MSESVASQPGIAPDTAADPRRWWALSVISLATIMVVLDATIVNIALPHAQVALRISNANRQWVVTAYSLPFGGLLLLGGRIADFRGRKLAFLAGLVGFAAASALGGAAGDQAVLFTARALQGCFAALLAPAALSLLNVTFTNRRERATAFGVYGAVLGGGSAIGLLAGGLLTEYADWRWCLYVNAPIAAIAFVSALPVITESKAQGATRYDIPGSILITAGLALLVFGLAEAVAKGWSAPETYGLLIGGVAGVLAFVVVEARGRHPLLPLRIVLDRNRSGAYLGSLLIFLAMMGMFLFLTYYMQGVLRYSALRTGLAILPLTAAVIIGSGVITGLMRVVPPRIILGVSFLLCAGGQVWFAAIGVHNAYVSDLLGPELIVGLGMAGVLVTATNLALLGVGGHDSGVASGLVSAAQQVGGSIGTALLNTVAADATASYLTSHAGTPLLAAHAAVHGFSYGFLVGAGVFALGALVTFALVTATPQEAAGAGMAGV
jgi:EmrB/QacA subfamily drug resistance transporter